MVWVGNKVLFVFDLFQNRISQLEKDISKKEETISFLTEQLLVRKINPFTISPNFSSQSKSRKKNCELKSS